MILIMGLPNAGKTTYSQNFENVIHYDEILGRHKDKQIIEMVKNNNDVCVEGVYGKISDRKKLIEVSNELNVCIWLDVPVETCIERELLYRNRDLEIIEWAAEKFEPPNLDEGWDEILILKNGEEIKL